MKINLAFWDRFLRYILGFTLLLWAFLGGPLWSWVGLILLGTASWGFCPFYALLGIKSYQQKIPPSREHKSDL
jgi:hypothetical protein